MGKLSPEKIKFEEIIIEHVKLRPAIWKKSHVDHANSIIVGNMWDCIYDLVKPTQFAASGQECAALWKNVWDQYLGFKRTIKGKTGKAGGRQRNYRHAMSMKCFDDPVEMSAMQSTLTNAAEDLFEEDGLFNERDEGSENGEGSSMSSGLQTVTVATVELVSPHSVASSTPKSTSKKSKLDPFAEQLIEVVRGRDLTDFEHFCSSIAIKMGKIAEVSPRAAVQLQSQIQTLVGETEVDVLYN